MYCRYEEERLPRVRAVHAHGSDMASPEDKEKYLYKPTFQVLWRPQVRCHNKLTAAYRCRRTFSLFFRSRLRLLALSLQQLPANAAVDEAQLPTAIVMYIGIQFVKDS